MLPLIDAFWRAAAYCLHPRVIALSVLPLLILVVLSLGLGYLWWTPAVDWVRHALDASTTMTRLAVWVETLGVPNLRAALAPLLVILAVTPVVVLASLLLVAVLMMPALVRLVGERRFPDLERKHGASLLFSVVWSVGSLVLAVVALAVSLPLWLVPPLILVLPPLIWGWLTYRVMTFDALAEYASADERAEVFRRHRGPLLVMGIISGFLGAVPSVVWASGALFAALFLVLVPVAIWIYTLVFAFSSLWFAHFALAALSRLRAEAAPGATVAPVTPVSAADPLPLPDEPAKLPAPGA